MTISLTEARRQTNLSRCFSPQLVGEIADAGGGQSLRQQNAAILFADLRGFTSFAENMPADGVADFLNDHRRRLSESIVGHGGMIDKFIGDGVMAIFGVPEPRAEELPTLRIGVGIHYGEVIQAPWATSSGSSARRSATPSTRLRESSGWPPSLANRF